MPNNKFRPIRPDEMEQLQDCCVSIAQQITTLRTKRDMQQKQLARIVGCNQPNVARLESGFTASLCLLTIIRVASALGCRLKITFEEK